MTTNTKTTEDRDNIDQIAGVLLSRGELFHGGDAWAAAREWHGYGFAPHGVHQWCADGVWDAAVADYLYEAGMTPRTTRAAADEMAATGDYAIGCPIYDCCNGKIHPRRIVEFWRAL